MARPRPGGLAEGATVIGRTIGPYRVLDKLGEGGMGAVYRVHDSKLQRDVAIKILLDVVANDPERLARFAREAQVLAALNHPNIAHVYGVENSSGVPALVMELVEGRTLADAIPALSGSEVIAIARQIAEALEAAHEQGIIHRDLKPANVKVRDDGIVKVLDFGLAKALEVPPLLRADAMNSPTLTVNATQMGVILGTAAYMAPEQARGKAVDRRADIWAFGCVLYEMLTGTRAFPGDTVSDTVSAVLTQEPDWSKCRSDVPRSVVDLARRCLRKDPRRRLQAIGDARLMLEEPQPDDVPASSSDRRDRPVRQWLGAGGLLALGVALGAALMGSRAERAPSARNVPMLIAEHLPLSLEEAPAFALSRDATLLVFVGGSGNSRRLYVRRLDDSAATPIEGTEGASGPFFSPDGQWVGFVANEVLKKVRLTGGNAPVRLSAATDRGGVWTDDDTIIYAPSRIGGLSGIPAAGGEPQPLTQVEGTSTMGHRFPSLGPGGRAVLFTARNQSDGGPAVYALDRATGRQTIVLAGAYRPLYCQPGRLLFMRGAALYVAPFDSQALTVDGPGRLVADGVRADLGVMSAQFTASETLLLYQPGALASDLSVLVWRDMAGNEQPFVAEPDTYRDPKFSFDGRHLAYSLIPGGLGTDLWVLDRGRGLKSRLTFETDLPEWSPAWAPDGLSIAYSDTKGIRLIPADGSGVPQALTQNAERWQIPTSFSPDGRYLAFHELNRETAGDIWILPLAPRGAPRVFLRTPFYEGLPVFSPNGRWLAYISNESGSFEIYVRPYPGPGPKYQVSGDQSFDQHYWSADGTQLFYRSGDGRRMMAVPVRTDRPEFEFGKPTVLFELNADEYPDLGFWGSFAAAPDGRGFVLVKRSKADRSARTHLMLRLDW